MTLEDLKTAVAAAYDEIELLDFLDIDITELVEILEDKINERRDDFRKELDI